MMCAFVSLLSSCTFSCTMSYSFSSSFIPFINLHFMFFFLFLSTLLPSWPFQQSQPLSIQPLFQSKYVSKSIIQQKDYVKKKENFCGDQFKMVKVHFFLSFFFFFFPTPGGKKWKSNMPRADRDFLSYKCELQFCGWISFSLPSRRKAWNALNDTFNHMAPHPRQSCQQKNVRLLN